MSLEIEGIPQRESIPDKKRDILLQKLRKKGIDETLLPVTPATVVCLGRIGGGKSSIMYSWLKNMFPNYYDEVIIFCSSRDSEKAFLNLPQKNIIFLDSYDDNYFNAYLGRLKDDQMERLNEKRPALNVFIGFDDTVFEQAISKGGKETAVQKAWETCRHEINATMFICCQHSKQINPAMRNNTLYYCVLGLQTNDVEKVANEHAGHLSIDDFLAMYRAITSKGRHDWLLIDYKAEEPRRFRYKFDTIIPQF